VNRASASAKPVASVATGAGVDHEERQASRRGPGERMVGLAQVDIVATGVRVQWRRVRHSPAPGERQQATDEPGRKHRPGCGSALATAPGVRKIPTPITETRTNIVASVSDRARGSRSSGCRSVSMGRGRRVTMVALRRSGRLHESASSDATIRTPEHGRGGTVPRAVGMGQGDAAVRCRVVWRRSRMRRRFLSSGWRFVDQGDSRVRSLVRP